MVNGMVNGGWGSSGEGGGVVVVVVVVVVVFSGMGAMMGLCAPFLLFFGFLFSLPCLDLSPIEFSSFQACWCALASGLG